MRVIETTGPGNYLVGRRSTWTMPRCGTGCWSEPWSEGGTTEEDRPRHAAGQRVEIPLDDVGSVRMRKLDASRTFLVVATSAVVFWIWFFPWVFAPET